MKNLNEGCSDLPNECDPAKNLACLGQTGSKTCALDYILLSLNSIFLIERLWIHLVARNLNTMIRSPQNAVNKKLNFLNFLSK